MKRCVCFSVFLLLLFFSLPCIFAGKVVLDTSASNGISINGMLGEFHDIIISPISNDGLNGMPFDIMGTDVWYNSGSVDGVGRLIAIWSIVMNGTTRSMTVKADPFKRVKDENGKAVAYNSNDDICYRISFTLRYYSYNNEEPEVNFKYLGVYGNGIPSEFGGDFWDNKVTVENSVVNKPFVSQNQPVRVILLKNGGIAYSSDERENWKSGIYEAIVTLEITGS